MFRREQVGSGHVQLCTAQMVAVFHRSADAVCVAQQEICQLHIDDVYEIETPQARKLVEVTQQSFFEGIKFAKAGNHLNDISAAIQKYAESFGFGVVRDLVGHGIGTNMHEEPEIPNFAQKRKGIKLAAGMTLAIEPMITAGRYDVAWMDVPCLYKA